MSGVLGGPKRSIALAVGLLAVLALTWFVLFRRPEPTPALVASLAVPEGQAGKAGEVQVTAEAMKLAEIDVEPAKLQQVRERLKVSGSIQAGGNQLAKVTPPAQGKAAKLLVAPGDKVRKGQLLALLDSAELARAQADYKQAIARSEALESALASQRQLAGLGAFGSEELEESRSRAVRAEKELQESNRSLASSQSRMTEAEGQLEVAKGEKQHARVELDYAKSKLGRAQALPKLLSLQQMERLKADVLQAEAQLIAAEAGVARSQAEMAAARASLGASRKEQPLARQEVEIRRSAVSREEKIYAGGHARNQELVQAETDAKLARVEADAAAENVRLLGGQPGAGNQLPLLAPISGTISEAKLTLGETVNTEHLAYTIVNLEEIYAELAIAPSDLGKVKVGDPVELFSDAAPQAPLQATLTSIGAAADPTTRTVTARARVKTPSSLLAAGSFVKGTIITDVRQDRLTVPEDALQDHVGRATLYVAKPDHKGLFEVRHVTLSNEKNEDRREVTEGLEPGELLATKGTFYLKSEAMKSALSDGCCAVGE